MYLYNFNPCCSGQWSRTVMHLDEVASVALS